MHPPKPPDTPITAGPTTGAPSNSGSNLHNYATSSSHVDSGGISCSAGWHAHTKGSNKRWDSGSHSNTTKLKVLQTGSWITSYGTFTNEEYGGLLHAGSNQDSSYASSTVGGIHTWTDLIYPRYSHKLSSCCGT